MSQPNIPPGSRTDANFQNIKLYIEGVQVPFLNMSVSSALGALPQAIVSVPPQVGLMEISRFYCPKVHIFFADPISGEDKVLFSGIIVTSNMSKSADGSAAITFSCQHRYRHMSELLVDYAGWVADRTNPNSEDGVVKSTASSSKYGIALALLGIIGDSTDGTIFANLKKEVSVENVKSDMVNNQNTVSPAFLPKDLNDFKNRLIGMPGVLVNLWNQLKQGAFWSSEENEIMLKMYVPLVEQGLQFFKRITGHFYIENKVEQERVDPCIGKPGTDAYNHPRLVPPSCKAFLKSAIQADIGVELINSNLEFSGELTDLMTIYTKFLETIDYEMLILNSPAEIMKDPSIDAAGYLTSKSKETYAADVIVKPQMPFYFSPKCNVLYPNMIRNLSVTQDDYSIPTRVTLRNDEIVQNGTRLSTYFRGPASIREAIASFSGTDKKQSSAVDSVLGTEVKAGTRETIDINFGPTNTTEHPHQNLQATLGPSHSKVGLFEQGRGLKSEKMIMPKWLSFYSNSQFRDDKGGDGLPDPTDTVNFTAVQQLAEGWKKRYGNNNEALNPWSSDSHLKAYQRLLIASVDYYYAMTMARSRSGQAETIFNPYIVVGYPMDILDSTPNHPSFHAYCTSVTHNITQGSISTNIGFASAMTYTELANYYLPSIHPWLQYVLGLAKSQSIVNYVPADTTDGQSTPSPFGSQGTLLEPDAKGVANRFYFSALGVTAVAPAELYDFNTGLVRSQRPRDPGILPIEMIQAGNTDSLRGDNGGEFNQMLTGTGNLRLVRREIESIDNVKIRCEIDFIDLSPGNYNTNVIRIKNQVLADKDALEPGQSQWLSYEPKFEDPSENPEG